MKSARKLWLAALLLLLVIGQCADVSAGAKSSSGKYEVKLNKSVCTVKKGKTVRLKAVLSKAAKGKKVEWSSSNRKVADVKPNGSVKAKKNGKTTITAKIAGTKAKASCKLTVGTPVQGIQLSQTSVSLEPGATFALKATVSPKKPSNKKIAFASDNSQVVSVSSKGVLTAKQEGTAKITVASVDGSDKKAVCQVTVSKKEILITQLTLNASEAALVPGEQIQLSASVQPENATNPTVQWTSSNAGVAAVGPSGLVHASGEGIATVYATSANGVRAACDVRVSYKGDVSSQAELALALSSKMVTNIRYTSNQAGEIIIPAGDYSRKTLEIHAPNAEVINRGRFAKVKISAIAERTYTECGKNVIDFHAANGRIVVEEGGIAAICLSDAGNQSVQLENNGLVQNLQVPAKARLAIAGQNAVPVSLGAGAAGTEVITEAELSIRASASWDMTILPGGENTKATIDDRLCMPSITGIGCIPVVVSAEQDVVHIPAEMKDGIEIDQSVAVSGTIQEYDLEEDAPDLSAEAVLDETDGSYHVKNQASVGTSIYMLPYQASNSDMHAENYEDYIEGLSAAAVSDEAGNYEIPDVRIGNYWLIVQKEGYAPVIQNLFITSFQTETYANNQIDLLSDAFAGIPNTEEISGTIVDGLTGESVNAEGLIIKLRTGSNSIAKAAEQTAVTDEDGRYRFEDIPAGVYTIEAIDVREGLSEDAIRYNPAYTTIIVAAPYLSSDRYNLIVNQRMQSITGSGLVQFTLEWGTEESGASADIDSHLIGPSADGDGTFHVYYSDQTYEIWDDEEYEYIRYADLDVDDTDYEGPEHTTIYQETPGIYRFYIHNFSERSSDNSDRMAKSSVRVTITIGSSAYTYYCPNQTGNLWYVCDYNSMTHTIVPKNIVSTFLEDESMIGMSEEELNERYLESAKQSALDAADTFEDYLAYFNDGAAKEAYMEQILSWKNQISLLTDYQEARRLSTVIQEAYDEMEYAIEHPWIVADNLLDYEMGSVEEDGTGRRFREFICQVLSGEELENLSVSYDGEEEAEYEIETMPDDSKGYRYVLHMSYANGLSCDYRIRCVDGSDLIASTILNYVRECNYILDMFEECEDIRNSRAEVSRLQQQGLAVTSRSELSEICYQIEEIRERYRYEISIGSVRAEGLEDWWETIIEETDEDDEVIGKKSVLRLDRDEDVTDAEILSKLIIEFEAYEESELPITYELIKLEADASYQALLKITNPATGHIRNTYIRITEY